MNDFDLAELYSVETAHLKRQVRRNLSRFPEDFMFQLTTNELKILRRQIGISSWGGTRYVPFVFTEQGVAMLSSVLNSRTAIKVNIQIIPVFRVLLCDDFFMMREIISSSPHTCQQRFHSSKYLFYVID